MAHVELLRVPLHRGHGGGRMEGGGGGKREDGAATGTLGVGRGLTDPFGDVSFTPDGAKDVSRTLASSVSCTGFESLSRLRSLEIDSRFKT